VEYGVPQDRQRVFVIGSRDGTDFAFPAPTHLSPRAYASLDVSGQAREATSAKVSSLQPFLTAWDAIGDLQDDDDPQLRMTGKWASLLPSIPEGGNYLFHTSRGGGLPLFGWRRRYWNFLLKLAKGLPSPTIAAQPGPAIGPFHWRNRRLSARELMRLQTFPKGYIIPSGIRSAQKQLGNAVPSALAEVLAREIRVQFFAESAKASSPKLIPKRRGTPPPPETPLPVPPEFVHLAGDHEPHPGTGLGFGALRRTGS
jgi:DNA (cytosine-5)-methyltransferase 1